MRVFVATLLLLTALRVASDVQSRYTGIDGVPTNVSVVESVSIELDTVALNHRPHARRLATISCADGSYVARTTDLACSPCPAGFFCLQNNKTVRALCCAFFTLLCTHAHAMIGVCPLPYSLFYSMLYLFSAPQCRKHVPPLRTACSTMHDCVYRW